MHCTGRAFERRDGKVVCESCGHEYRPRAAVSPQFDRELLWRIRWIDRGMQYTAIVRVLRGVVIDGPTVLRRFIGESLRTAERALHGKAQPIAIRSLLDVVPESEGEAPGEE
ncbi:MAG: hypothetical protein E6Q97_30740 [Desulfurellales bacterium]|nr:MAG: hypothetical protein E6Q97_30740 [Desulfurellales bacterium]